MAHGSQVRVLRRHLAYWLEGDHLDAEAVDDLVMAASEALENCCDHAFTGASAVGTMTLTARPCDRGWSSPSPTTAAGSSRQPRPVFADGDWR